MLQCCKNMGWPWCCFRNEPAYKKVGADPAQSISARLESEYDVENFQLKNTVSSLYRRVSEWSLPKKVEEKKNLFTLNEEEHDFLIDDHDTEENEELELEFPGNDVERFSRPKHTVSSIYNKVSDWSFPNKTHTKLSTVREGDHESLMDEYTPRSPSPSPSSSVGYAGPSPSPSSSQGKVQEDFDDVVDKIV